MPAETVTCSEIFTKTFCVICRVPETMENSTAELPELLHQSFVKNDELIEELKKGLM